MPKQLLEHGRSRAGNGLSASKNLCRTGVFRHTRRYPGRSGPILKFSYWGRHGLPGYLVFSVKHLPKKKGYPGKVPKSTSAPIENFLSGGALPGYLEKAPGRTTRAGKRSAGVRGRSTKTPSQRIRCRAAGARRRQVRRVLVAGLQASTVRPGAPGPERLAAPLFARDRKLHRANLDDTNLHRRVTECAPSPHNPDSICWIGCLQIAELFPAHRISIFFSENGPPARVRVCSRSLN